MTHDRPMSKFEFAALAAQRATQLLRGCTPRVEGEGKPAKVAAREIASGAVGRLDASE